MADSYEFLKAHYDRIVAEQSENRRDRQVLGTKRWLWLRFGYRRVMRFAHRFNWHYAPPCYPDGDTMLWCQWCGLRQVVKRRTHSPSISGPSRTKPAGIERSHLQNPNGTLAR